MYVPFDEDFATVNPYLGSDGVKPFIEVCQEEGKGIFVLVKTSNPSSGEFQDQLVDGRPLYELVGEKVASGARSTWATPTAMWEPLWAPPIRRWEQSSEADAEDLHPGAGIWSPGRPGEGSGELLQ